MNRYSAYKVISVFLACFILASTSMTSMRLHFCGNQIAGVSLFDSTGNCCAEQETSSCTFASESTDCCQDKVIDLDWDVDIITPSITTEDHVDYQYITYHNIFLSQEGLNPSIIALIAEESPILNEKRVILFEQFLL